MGRFIQKSKLKKGALSRQLGIPIKKNIPTTLLDRIISAKIGNTIINPTQSGNDKFKITRLLKRRAILARTLKNFRSTKRQ